MPLLFHLGCALLALYLIKQLRSAKAKTPRRLLPPGPPGLPLLGNLFDWPTSNQWVTLSNWAEVYGDIIYANVLGTNMVVLNSVKVATDLLSQKGAIYSDRARFHFVAKLVGWEHDNVFMDLGPDLKESRRLVMQELGPRGKLKELSHTTESETKMFLGRLLDNPSSDAIHDHIRRWAGTIILDITYGYHVEKPNDEFVKYAEGVMADISVAAKPGAYLVDQFTWLEHVPSWAPGAGFKIEAERMRRLLHNFVNVPYQYVKDQMAKGDFRPSFISRNLENRTLTAEEEHLLKWTATSFFAGGAHTSVSVLYAFFLYMTLYPEIQRKAQAEIDAVVGTDRLPSLSDLPHLPYVEAIVKEVFRCNQVLPLGVPHVLREDDVYNGYVLPKGTICLANIWFMMHDPRIYKDPHVFNPSRFLGGDPEPDPRASVFGFGRRICPGRYLAIDNLFIGCAMSLATLDICKEIDSNGNEITPSIEMVGQMLTHPRQFPCTIKPRSLQAEAFIKAAH